MMYTLKNIGILLLLILGFSCSENELTQEQEAQVLEELFTEIEKSASNVSCSDASEWSFTNYGNKACGGPLGFIAYSKTIDTATFLEKIEMYSNKQKEFNKKWGIVSDCSLPAQPSKVICVDGIPVFEY